MEKEIGRSAGERPDGKPEFDDAFDTEVDEEVVDV
jgi:hypothetical protein